MGAHYQGDVPRGSTRCCAQYAGRAGQVKGVDHQPGHAAAPQVLGVYRAHHGARGVGEKGGQANDAMRGSQLGRQPSRAGAGI